MKIPLARRLNLITGDNGLGKSFLLDVAWWALTRTWARQLVRPLPGAKAPSIKYRYSKPRPPAFEATSHYDRRREKWPVPAGRPPIAGLVLYAQVDGGFSVWDPHRNYWRRDDPERPSAYHFTAEQVWEGNPLCEGLIRDWASWQREDAAAFGELKRVLDVLSPRDDEPLRAGPLIKLSVDDPRRYPTLQMPYGQDVPVPHASAGMRRVIALAYLLVWAWHEHLAAARLIGSSPTSEVIFLIDEIEAHLHPTWQRKIVPALLAVMDKLTGKHGSHVQLITATHSPLVMSSAEPDFDSKQDAWFDLDLEAGPSGKLVVLHPRSFEPQGTAGRWLTSKAFDLASEGRAPKIEALLDEAAKALSRNDFPAPAARKLDQKLRKVLGPMDPFWSRWRFVAEQRGWIAPTATKAGTPAKAPKKTKRRS